MLAFSFATYSNYIQYGCLNRLPCLIKIRHRALEISRDLVDLDLVVCQNYELWEVDFPKLLIVGLHWSAYNI